MIITEIATPFWQNPQCYIHMEYQRDELKVYTTCFNEKALIIENQLGLITFEGVRGFESHRQIKVYYADEIKFRSSILRIENSDYLNQYVLKETDSENSNLKHFVVDSHDHQLSILAEKFEFSTIKVIGMEKDIFERLL